MSILKRFWCFLFGCKPLKKFYATPEPSVLKALEKDILDEICQYKGKQLIPVKFLSDQCYEHCLYMSKEEEASHDFFDERVKNVKNMYGENSQVREIVAYNYSTPRSFVHAWLNSPKHKEVIDKDADYAGVATYMNKEGDIYASMIFLKL